jgi:hypothetical protein
LTAGNSQNKNLKETTIKFWAVMMAIENTAAPIASKISHCIDRLKKDIALYFLHILCGLNILNPNLYRRPLKLI